MSGQAMNEKILSEDELNERDYKENILKVVHPAMFRNDPLHFIGYLFLIGISGYGLIRTYAADQMILAGLCAIPLLYGLLGFGIWYLRVLYTTVTITNKRTRYRVGIISKDTSEVLHDDVRNIQIDQSLVQRILGVGDIALSSSGQDDMEIKVSGLPDPEGLAALVRRYQ
ncbi:Membrane-flanked domain DUF304 [Planctomycetales bacterium 10988]|nr:Membrane-flanked domain DUF304 [Planctomycetales bacterium 10988]